MPEAFDAAGLLVMPGAIDTPVHFREPGLEWKEDLETGSRAAVLGCVVAVFEMPNTEPSTTDPDAPADKLSRASGQNLTLESRRSAVGLLVERPLPGPEPTVRIDPERTFPPRCDPGMVADVLRAVGQPSS